MVIQKADIVLLPQGAGSYLKENNILQHATEPHDKKVMFQFF